MIKLLKDDSGIATIWISVLASIFSFALLYAIIYDVFNVYLIDVAIDISTPETAQVYFDNIDRFRVVMNVLPFFAIFGIVLWAYVHSQKREYQYE